MAKLILLLALAAGAWLWWRRATAPAAMRPSEARSLLGLGENASAADIRDAHRRLIARVHPDAGGSAELAMRVNQARDALIADLKRRSPRAS